MGNEETLRQVKQQSFYQFLNHEFPIYGHQIENRISKALIRRKFFDKAAILLSSSFPMFNPTHLIVKDILDCVCNIPDLIRFCDD